MEINITMKIIQRQVRVLPIFNDGDIKRPKAIPKSIEKYTNEWPPKH